MRSFKDWFDDHHAIIFIYQREEDGKVKFGQNTDIIQSQTSVASKKHVITTHHHVQKLNIAFLSLHNNTRYGQS